MSGTRKAIFGCGSAVPPNLRGEGGYDCAGHGVDSAFTVDENQQVSPCLTADLCTVWSQRILEETRYKGSVIKNSFDGIFFEKLPTDVVLNQNVWKNALAIGCDRCVIAVITGTAYLNPLTGNLITSPDLVIRGINEIAARCGLEVVDPLARRAHALCGIFRGNL